SIGEYAALTRADWQEARRISVAPAKEGQHIAGPGEALRSTLLYRPVVQGDLISTSVFHRAPPGAPHEQLGETFFHNSQQSPAFGLIEIRFMITATVPKGIVRVSESTQIELSSAYREAAGGRGFIGATYDDLGGMRAVVDTVR